MVDRQMLPRQTKSTESWSAMVSDGGWDGEGGALEEQKSNGARHRARLRLEWAARSWARLVLRGKANRDKETEKEG